MESSSGLIMKVIRTLTNSKDDAERDAIKKRLEDALSDSDQKLTNLVSDNYKELRQVMQTFTNISKNLQESMTTLSSAKQRLTDCRETLISRLDELKRLSDDSIRNEKILTLLDQIDEISRVPAQINELLINEEYYEATKLLLDGQSYIDENFESFDCLKDIRAELDCKREEIYRILEEKRSLQEDDNMKGKIIESLKMIDKTPEDPELDMMREWCESRTTKPSLFKFSRSSHAICFNEHYKEQNNRY